MSQDQPLAQYWAVIAQVVPVLALALVLEVRRVASKWTYEQRWRRVTQSITFLLIGMLLATAEIQSLIALLSGRPSPTIAAAAGIMVMVAMAALVINPLTDLFTSANVDVVASAVLRFYWTPTRRRQLRKLEPGISQSAERALEDYDLVCTQEREIRGSLRQVRRARARLIDGASRASRSPGEHLELLNGDEDVLLGQLARSREQRETLIALIMKIDGFLTDFESKLSFVETAASRKEIISQMKLAFEEEIAKDL